jgi:hypothetical protein
MTLYKQKLPSRDTIDSNLSITQEPAALSLYLSSYSIFKVTPTSSSGKDARFSAEKLQSESVRGHLALTQTTITLGNTRKDNRMSDIKILALLLTGIGLYMVITIPMTPIYFGIVIVTSIWGLKALLS